MQIYRSTVEAIFENIEKGDYLKASEIVNSSNINPCKIIDNYIQNIAKVPLKHVETALEMSKKNC